MNINNNLTKHMSKTKSKEQKQCPIIQKTVFVIFEQAADNMKPHLNLVGK